PISAANSTDVSRNAATAATGARVIAKSTIPYAPTLAAAPSRPLRQRRTRYEAAARRPRHRIQAMNGKPSIVISHVTYAIGLPDARAALPSTSVYAAITKAVRTHTHPAPH